MEAGLPDVTGNDSGGVFTGLAPLSTRSTSKSASLQCILVTTSSSRCFWSVWGFNCCSPPSMPAWWLAGRTCPRLGKAQFGISLHPVICSTAAVRSSLYSSVFVMGFGDNKAYAVTNYNQQSSLKC